MGFSGKEVVESGVTGGIGLEMPCLSIRLMWDVKTIVKAVII